MDEFKNEPFVDFSKPENAAAMQAAIEKVRGELGREYPNVINGEKVALESKFQSINPANTSEVVGIFSEVDTDTTLVEQGDRCGDRCFQIVAERVSRRKGGLFVPDGRHHASAKARVFGVDGFRGRQDLGRGRW